MYTMYSTEKTQSVHITNQHVNKCLYHTETLGHRLGLLCMPLPYQRCEYSALSTELSACVHLHTERAKCSWFSSDDGGYEVPARYERT